MEANMSVKADDIMTEEEVDEISINENQRAQTIFNKDINDPSESEAQYCCALEYGLYGKHHAMRNLMSSNMQNLEEIMLQLSA